MSRSLARRYARAIVESVHEKGGDLTKLLDELETLQDLITKDPKVVRYLTQPIVPMKDRLDLARTIAQKGGFSKEVGNLLCIMVEKERFASYGEVVEEARLLVDDIMSQVRGEIKTAQPLSDEDLKLLEEGFASVIGKRVVLDVVEDPSLIGGVMAVVGGVVFDGTVRSNLNKVREKLIEE